MGAPLPGVNELRLNAAVMKQIVQEYIDAHGGEFEASKVTDVVFMNGWYVITLSSETNG